MIDNKKNWQIHLGLDPLNHHMNIKQVDNAKFYLSINPTAL